MKNPATSVVFVGSLGTKAGVYPRQSAVHDSAEMALRNEDRDWVRQQIADALDGLRPRGWRRAVYFLREWSILGATATVIVALLSIAFGAVYFGVSTGVDNAQFRQKTEDRLSAIETSLLALRTVIAAARPTDKKNLIEAKEVLALAKKNSIRLPSDIVEQAGKTFIEASTQEPLAWDTALRFVDYRSYLNAYVPDIIPSNLRKLVTHYDYEVPTGHEPPQLSVGAPVPENQAARLGRIGSPIKTETPGYGNQSIVGRGGALQLDGYELKSVILDNVLVKYNGGPLKMDNVTFINCTFDVARGTNGQKLAAVILSSLATKLDNA